MTGHSEQSAHADRYEPLMELGRGGMGTALLAKVTGSGGFERLVVIKRLHGRLHDQPRALNQFFDEARLVAHVHHANVVGVQRVAMDDAGPFLVLDYVEGSSLSQLVMEARLRGARLAAEVALRIALDALAGLHAVHEACDAEGSALGVLHRDVSPQNVLVGIDGVARIADFGIAKSSARRRTTDPACVLGKLVYMAPEYLARDTVDRRMDVYGLGVTLWYSLAGQCPWSGLTDEQIIVRLFTDGVPGLSPATPIAPQIEAIVMKACARAPDQRYPTAREMARAIEAAGRQIGCVATHAEVADSVRELAGREVSGRRRIVAQMAHSTRQSEAETATRPRLKTSSGAAPPEHARGRVRSAGWVKRFVGAGIGAAMLSLPLAARMGQPEAASSAAAAAVTASMRATPAHAARTVPVNTPAEATANPVRHPINQTAGEALPLAGSLENPGSPRPRLNTTASGGRGSESTRDRGLPQRPRARARRESIVTTNPYR